MDRYSRRILGWSVSSRRDAALTRTALCLSVRNRQPGTKLMFHSDRGIEYAAFEYRNQLARLGITQSMNRPGRMNDNAHMESFFHSMKAEDLNARVTTLSRWRIAVVFIGYFRSGNQCRLFQAHGRVALRCDSLEMAINRGLTCSTEPARKRLRLSAVARRAG